MDSFSFGFGVLISCICWGSVYYLTCQKCDFLVRISNRRLVTIEKIKDSWIGLKKEWDHPVPDATLKRSYMCNIDRILTDYIGDVR